MGGEEERNNREKRGHIERKERNVAETQNSGGNSNK
jgi:hypothetical protein